MNLHFITGNEWKFNEIKESISSKISLYQKDIDLQEIQTTSLEKISKDKALKAYNQVKEPVLVDDTWVYFNHYNNFPGALTKFIYKSLWKEWLKRLFIDVEDNSWVFETALSYMDDKLSEPISFVWKVEWKFEFDSLEDGYHYTLPYNYIFIPEGWSNTVAENYKEWKSQFSQRKKALEQLNNYFENF